MYHIRTSLIREKFVIEDLQKSGENQPVSEIARSNRIEIPYFDSSGTLREKIVVRSQNMHIGLRLAARIVQAHMAEGSIRHRGNPLDWEEIWYQISESFERSNNPSVWVAVYHDGEILFEYTERHPFLDVIEKCEVRNKKDYDNSVNLAETSFSRLEKKVKIHHDSNVAAVIHANRQRGRCGIVFRHAQKTTTFQVGFDPLEDSALSPVTCFNVCAAFLEGIQLAYQGGALKNTIYVEDLKSSSDEGRKLARILERMKRLNIELRTTEKMHAIHYRPERPDFFDILEDAKNIFYNRYLEDVKKREEQEKLEEMAQEDIRLNDQFDINDHMADTVAAKEPQKRKEKSSW